MYNNGVSHITAKDDLHGVSEIMNWLSYVPEKRNAPVPIYPSLDEWDRDVEYTPPKGAYDVRWLLEGKQEDEFFLRGFFDRGSFRESLSGWAKTVVCIFQKSILMLGGWPSSPWWHPDGCYRS
jgi:acetyl-CoA carboxylase / biotin carboxylase 1